MISSDCSRDRHCKNQKCVDPCPGTCGINAICKVINHSPVCSCNHGYTGDPFIRCLPEESKRPQKYSIKNQINSISPKPITNQFFLEGPIISDETNICTPTVCGRNALCRVHDSRAVCSCLPKYQGRPPNCRPECSVSTDCPNHLACANEKCVDPCHGTCGINTLCTVRSHIPMCSCEQGYSGDPYSVCQKTTQSKI